MRIADSRERLCRTRPLDGGEPDGWSIDLVRARSGPQVMERTCGPGRWGRSETAWASVIPRLYGDICCTRASAANRAGRGLYACLAPSLADAGASNAW
jgi:hypothetical protein